VPSTGSCSIWFDVSAFVTEMWPLITAAHPNSAACTVCLVCEAPAEAFERPVSPTCLERSNTSQRPLELS
jgi:hypothetical protein